MSSVCPPGTSWDDASQWCRPDANPTPEDPTPDPSGCPPGTDYVNGQGCIPRTGGGTSGGAAECEAAGNVWDYQENRCWPITTKPQQPGNNTGNNSGGMGGDDWPTYFGPNRPQFDLPNLPKPNFTRFQAPTLDDAYNEPGYAFARDEGLQALEQSAAGRGVLRTGGTLKNIVSWGNKFAEQNYGNVFNRALQSYDRLFGVEQAEFAPLMTEYLTKAAGNQRAGELEFGRFWEKYLADIDRFKWMNPSASDLLNAELGSV